MAALIAASCSSSDGPNGPPALTNSIVFVSDRTGTDQIYVMEADGSNLRQLTTIDGVKTWPAVSTSGRKIAFSIGAIDSTSTSELYVMNSDGTELKQLTFAQGLNFKPSWSPDGTRIAFASSRDGNYEIYTMKSDGSEQTDVTKEPGQDYAPSWQPTGNTILFMTDLSNPVDTYTVTSITSTGDSIKGLTYGVQPEWSPSGSKFVYKYNHMIWLSSTPDGSNVTPIIADSVTHYTPTWSPNEMRLAFSRVGNDGHEEIWTMSASDGGDEHELTLDDEGNNRFPTWTRH